MTDVSVPATQNARTIDVLDPPALAGVEHVYVTTSGGVKIHVAVAGPVDGPGVMLVHGFPQHWWEWHRVIGPLAADGYRVIVPDLRGAGWSDAPRGPYRKAVMAGDLAAVVGELVTGPVKVAAHDWGGPVAFILMAEHPELVSGFLGLNTIAPLLRLDGPTVRHLPMFWYQLAIMMPGLGPRLLRAPTRRFMRFLVRWVGGGYMWSEADTEVYLSRMRDPARAYAGSQWYRTFQAREFLSWVRGEYRDVKLGVPVRWVTGLNDPVVAPVLHRCYRPFAEDQQFEHVPGVGHWIIEEAHELVLDRLRAFCALAPSGR